MSIQLDEIINKIKNELGKKSNKLILIVGDTIINEDLSTKLSTLQEIQCFNLNLLLSKKLIDLSNKERSRPLEIIEEILNKEFRKNVILFNKINILFDSKLKWNPFDILKKIARNYIIIAMWDGEFDGAFLKYAKTGHTESVQFPYSQDSNLCVLKSEHEPYNQ